MARPTTLPKPWIDLAAAVGGIDALRAQLGWSSMVFYRRARGIVRTPPKEFDRVGALAKKYRLPNPVPPSRKVATANVDPLLFLGQALIRDFPPSRKEIKALRTRYPDDVLIQLAEQDGTHPDVMRAVAYLLGE